MAEESSPHQDGGHSHAVSWWVGTTVILLLYILSPPPLAWMFEQFGWDDPEWPQYVYAPIIILYDQFEPVKHFYDSYSELLGVDL